MAAQAGLCLALSQTPEDTFCRVVAHNVCMHVFYVANVMLTKAKFPRAMVLLAKLFFIEKYAGVN